jgi:hypothetical protein
LALRNIRLAGAPGSQDNILPRPKTWFSMGYGSLIVAVLHELAATNPWSLFDIGIGIAFSIFNLYFLDFSLS